MNLHSRIKLIKRLEGKASRDAFVSAHIDTGLAFQIRALRQKGNWSQEDLAGRLSTSQNAVCRLESPDYGRASINTLKKIASVFDVALVVRFVRFSTLVKDVIDLSTESVIVDKYEDDKGLNPPISTETPIEADVALAMTGTQTIIDQLGVNTPQLLEQLESNAQSGALNATSMGIYH